MNDLQHRLRSRYVGRRLPLWSWRGTACSAELTGRPRSELTSARLARSRRTQPHRVTLRTAPLRRALAAAGRWSTTRTTSVPAAPGSPRTTLRPRPARLSPRRADAAPPMAGQPGRRADLVTAAALLRRPGAALAPSATRTARSVARRVGAPQWPAARPRERFAALLAATAAAGAAASPLAPPPTSSGWLPAEPGPVGRLSAADDPSAGLWRQWRWLVESGA